MTNLLFEVAADEVEKLNAIDYATMLNRLLRAEFERLKLRPGGVETTTRLYEGDGGLDARTVKDRGDPTSDYIPDGECLWQWKSGDLTAGEITIELQKAQHQAVRNALQAGATYRLVIGSSPGATGLKKRKKALADALVGLGVPSDRAQILTSSDVAQWVNKHPALWFSSIFYRPRGGLTNWTSWKQSGTFDNAFQADQARTQAVELLSGALQEQGGENTQTSCRLEGRLDIGKTRLALEATSDSALCERTLYAGTPEDVPVEFWEWMRQHSQAEVILVVDECDDPDVVSALEAKAARCRFDDGPLQGQPGRLKLLTIGRARGPNRERPANHLFIEQLSDAAVVKAVEAAYPQLPAHAPLWVARAVAGEIGTALALARALERRRARGELSASAHDLLHVSQIQEWAAWLVPDAGDARALEPISLLTRLGFAREFEGEGQAVASALSVSWSDVKQRVPTLIADGLVVKRGRFLSVRHPLLALGFAQRVWEAGLDPIALWEALPSIESRAAFLERLADLGDAPVAVRTGERLWSEENGFRDVDGLLARAWMLKALTQMNPLVALQTLERFLGPFNEVDLREVSARNYNRGRLEVVWSLDLLAWHRETFFGAARLLLNLEEAGWTAHTGLSWAGLFGTYLGGTEVPALDRHPLIEEALRSPSEARGLLAVRAIAFALVPDEARAVHGELQGGRLVAPEWKPATPEADRAVRESGLSLLEQALNVDSPVVRRAAEELLDGTADICVRWGLTDALLDVVERLPFSSDAAGYERRRIVCSLLETVLHFDADLITEPQRARMELFCQTLRGQGFHERLRRATGRRTHAEIQADFQALQNGEGDVVAREAALMAEEAMRSPEVLAPELPFLVSGEVFNVSPFARRLGQLDEEYHQWAAVEEQVRGGRGYAFAGAYLAGQQDAGRIKWREEVLDGWMQGAQKGAMGAHTEASSGFRDVGEVLLSVLLQSDGRMPTDHTLGRLKQLVESNVIKPSRLILLAEGVTRRSSFAPLQYLVEAMLSRIDASVQTFEQTKDYQDTISLALAWTLDRLDTHPEDEVALASLLWRIIERPGVSLESLASRRHKGFLGALTHVDPRRLAQALLPIFIRSPMGEEVAKQIFREVARLDVYGVWEETAARLLESPQSRAQLRYALGRRDFAELCDEELLDWAERHLPNGPHALASLTPVVAPVSREEHDGGDLAQTEAAPAFHPLARGLLMRFPSDVAVGEVLYNNFVEGSFAGSLSGWLRSRRNIAAGWLSDSNFVINHWTRWAVNSIDKQLAELIDVSEEGIPGVGYIF